MASNGAGDLGSLRRVGQPWFARLALAVGLVAAPALADASDWLQRYDADARCPGEPTFRAALAGRLARPPEDAFDGVRMSIDIARVPGSEAWRARVEMTDAAGVTTAREIKDASCDAVVHAASLLAALSLVWSADRVGVGDGEAIGGESISAPGVVEDQPAASPVAAVDEAGHFGVVALAAAHGAMAPRVSVGVGLGAFFELPGEGPWRPWFQLSVMRLGSGEVPLPRYAVMTEFNAVLLEASACPVRIGPTAPWSLRPCVDLLAGRLTASSEGQILEGPLDRRAPWLSVGPSLRGEVSIWSRLHASVVLGANLPLARHEFYFEPAILAYRVPALGIRAAGALSLSF